MKRNPNWLIGPPPCTACCSWTVHTNYRKMPKEKVNTMFEEGRLHPRFVISLYRVQIEASRSFLREYPAGALSWKDSHMEELLKDVTIDSVVPHPCAYGLLNPGPGDAPVQAKTPTRWAPKSPQMLRRLSRRCQGNHKHQPL